LAFDYIMTFPGALADHILPDKVHTISVSFLVETLRRQRGGVAGNIAYSLALLGERPTLVGAGGSDFAAYRAAFLGLGIDMAAVLDVEEELTASAFMISDLRASQVMAFYPGASKRAAEFSVSALAAEARVGLVGATTLEAMRRHTAELAEAGCPVIYDPSQQLVALPAEDILAGVERAWAVVGNDYEYAMIERKTGLTVDQLSARVPLVVITYGGQGSELRYHGEAVSIPVAPTTDLVDPTGSGDAYRAGLIKGLLLGFELAVVGRLAALAATFALERHGPQEHVYSAESFVARFDRAFPDYTGAISPDALRHEADASRWLPPRVLTSSPIRR